MPRRSVPIAKGDVVADPDTPYGRYRSSQSQVDAISAGCYVGTPEAMYAGREVSTEPIGGTGSARFSRALLRGRDWW